MGFDVVGPTRHICASNVDDGDEPTYDILAMPSEYGLNCPQLEKLNQRFYESTTLYFTKGDVDALRAEILQVLNAYRSRRELELVEQHEVRAKNTEVRSAIVERLILKDHLYCVLEEFRLLCEEAIAVKADVQCDGD